jgi:hypothetical protein
MALEQVFFKVPRFPLPVLIPPLLHAHLSSGAGTVGQLVADAPSGLGPPPPKKSKEKESGQ